LQRSFPHKSPGEIRHLATLYYRHLCDLGVESLKIFSISIEEAIARNRIVNPEVAGRFYDEGRSIIFSAGHYNNWELCVLASDAQLKHKSVGVYTPIRNAYFERVMRKTRGRYGMELVPKKEIKAFHEKNRHRLTATILANDQAPSPSTKRAYRMMFLNQETDVMFGTEKFAREYDYPVVFAAITKVKRGWYETRLQVMEEHPRNTPYGDITERMTRLIEAQILEEPQYWLWSHKRWKKRNYAVDRAGSAGQHRDPSNDNAGGPRA
jgi:KDO2-lipid IV(A) lauroyltransferase